VNPLRHYVQTMPSRRYAEVAKGDRAVGTVAGAPVSIGNAGTAQNTAAGDHSGGETLDGPDGSGNPFAAGLVEAMADPTLDFVGACAALCHRTGVLSGGRMTAETIGRRSCTGLAVGAGGQ
jgi:hypothetical protein